MQSLYERLGGEAAILAAVDVFYSKVLADDLTRPFFEGLDMDAQTKKQIAFMARAFGGPEEYHGRDLRSSHAALVRDKGLNDAHFDRIALHLEATLQEMRVPAGLIAEVLGLIGGTRNEILDR
jgi:hemoglobin